MTHDQPFMIMKSYWMHISSWKQRRNQTLETKRLNTFQHWKMHCTKV